MSGPTSNSRVSAGAFTVTVGGEPRFVDTVRLLTHKAAEADGCAESDADRLAEAVEYVLRAFMDTSVAPPESVDVRFAPSNDMLQVEIGVPQSGAGGRSVEAVLEQRGLLPGLRRLVPDVQFIRTGGMDLCRFRCPRAPRRTPDR